MVPSQVRQRTDRVVDAVAAPGVRRGAGRIRLRRGRGAHARCGAAGPELRGIEAHRQDVDPAGLGARERDQILPIQLRTGDQLAAAATILSSMRNGASGRNASRAFAVVNDSACPAASAGSRRGNGCRSTSEAKRRYRTGRRLAARCCRPNRSPGVKMVGDGGSVLADARDDAAGLAARGGPAERAPPRGWARNSTTAG